MAAAPASNNSDDSVWYFWTKDEADKFKHKLNGLSTSVDILKVAAGVAALGITPAKIDASIFKMDEKGIVIGGVQKFTWPHARDEKAKLEAADKKLLKLSQRAEKAHSTANNAVTMARRLQERVGGTGNWATDAQNKRAERAERKATEAFKKTQETYRTIDRMTREAEEKTKLVEDQRKTVERSLNTMKSGIEDLRTKLHNLESAVGR